MSKPVMSDLFRFSGRRNRKSYALYILVVIAIQFVLTALLGVVSGLAELSGQFGDDPGGAAAMSGISLEAMIVIVPVSIAIMVSGFAVGAQRCRDFGWTGWAILIVLVPAVGTLFVLAILFIPGNEGANKYGPDPLAQYA